MSLHNILFGETSDGLQHAVYHSSQGNNEARPMENSIQEFWEVNNSLKSISNELSEHEMLIEYLRILYAINKLVERQKGDGCREWNSCNDYIDSCITIINKNLMTEHTQIPLKIFVWVTRRKIECILNFIGDIFGDCQVNDQMPIKHYLFENFYEEMMEYAMKDIPNDCEKVKKFWENSIFLREVQLNPRKFVGNHLPLDEKNFPPKAIVDGLFNELFADMRGKPSKHVLYEKAFGFPRFINCYLCGIGQEKPSMTTNVSGPSCSTCKNYFCRDCLVGQAKALSGFAFDYGNPNHAYNQEIDWSCSACRNPDAFLTYLIYGIGKRHKLTLPTKIPISVQRYQDFNVNFVYALMKHKNQHAKLKDAVEMLFLHKWEIIDIMQHFGFF